jgi:D-glycero-alpha-D-manno-heptose-7-phosphate kinase
MITSKAPLRITLGGGGTDLPSYYEKYEGYLIAGTIDKYMYSTANKPFIKTIKVRYSKYEEVNKVDEIKHNLFREALKMYDIDSIEIDSLADIPTGTGLGSSGAFLVSLLNTLSIYKYGRVASPREVADQACRIELDILKETEGKQDKYAAAFGGIKGYSISKNGFVSVVPLRNEDLIISELKKNLLLFYTGIKRTNLASDALKYQVDKSKEDSDYINMLHEIKSIGLKSKDVLESLYLDKYGDLLDRHWEVKKSYAPHSTSQQIDDIYKKAKGIGATGGKVIGAPGGGFMMFYVPGVEKDMWNFINEMQKLNMRHIDYNFDNEGVRLVCK